MAVEPSSVPITTRGRYFWRGDERFFVRGVVYQPQKTHKPPLEPNDPLEDDRISELEQNIPLFTELGVNTLYIYTINNNKPHAKAMKLLEQAGLYVMVTVATPHCSINRANPYDSYNPTNVASFLKTAGIMASYPNTLGIVAADSVVHSKDTLRASPVIRAVIRDLKQYLSWSNNHHGKRILPVSYSAADIASINRQPGFMEYLYFGDKSSTIDFWMSANYSWVGKSSMAVSGWNSLIRRHEPFAIPSILAEYGANTYIPRHFHETRALYSDPMTRVFSGGCAYQFEDSPNRYGLIALPGTDEAKWFKDSDILEKRVKETRKTDHGNLHIYHDFANYKAALAEPIDYDPTWDIMVNEAAERHSADTTQMSWPWGSEYQIPETCIDWDNIEELVDHHVQSSLEITRQELEDTSIA